MENAKFWSENTSVGKCTCFQLTGERHIVGKRIHSLAEVHVSDELRVAVRHLLQVRLEERHTLQEAPACSPRARATPVEGTLWVGSV